MRVYKIVSFSVVILLLAVLFAGVVPAAAQYDTMQFHYDAAHTGDYSPVAGSVPSNCLGSASATYLALVRINRKAESNYVNHVCEPAHQRGRPHGNS
jgi:hypothetical protein